MTNNKVFIVAAKRTPIGSFMGSLSTVSVTELGAISVKASLEQARLNPEEVQEVLMGNVLQANVGQAPARQAALRAGIPKYVPCTTVNKVCSSGMKAVSIGVQTILLGDNDVVIAGGMENMSQVPHYIDIIRGGKKFGNSNLIDGMLKDGLLDAYSNNHMGIYADMCAQKYQISRKEQDEYALESYERSKRAWEEGKFKDEIATVNVKQRKGDYILVSQDEEYKNVRKEKVFSLPPAFQKEGSVTAANASTLNDGAASLVLMSEKKVRETKSTPLAKILSYADASKEPKWFTIAPEKALTKALNKAKLNIKDVDFFEINEAFSVVGLVNTKILGIPHTKINVNGGAVSLGHPLGCSGARIITTLLYTLLTNNNVKYGAAAICNGGGGASALVIEKL